MGFHVPVFRGTSVLLAAFAVAAGGGWLTGCETRVQGIMDYSLLLGVKRKEFHVNASVNLVQHNPLACAMLISDATLPHRPCVCWRGCGTCEQTQLYQNRLERELHGGAGAGAGAGAG